MLMRTGMHGIFGVQYRSLMCCWAQASIISPGFSQSINSSMSHIATCFVVSRLLAITLSLSLFPGSWSNSSVMRSLCVTSQGTLPSIVCTLRNLDNLLLDTRIIVAEVVAVAMAGIVTIYDDFPLFFQIYYEFL